MDHSQFRSECLKAHNAYRMVHGAEPLEELKELNDYAQNWAEHMASTLSFGHSHGPYGENIAYRMQSKNPTGEQLSTYYRLYRIQNTYISSRVAYTNVSQFLSTSRPTFLRNIPPRTT